MRGLFIAGLIFLASCQPSCCYMADCNQQPIKETQKTEPSVGKATQEPQKARAFKCSYKRDCKQKRKTKTTVKQKKRQSAKSRSSKGSCKSGGNDESASEKSNAEKEKAEGPATEETKEPAESRPIPVVLSANTRAYMESVAPQTLSRLDSGHTLSLNDVSTLTKLGFSDDMILYNLDRTDTKLALTSQQKAQLEQSGVRPTVIAHLSGSPQPAAPAEKSAESETKEKEQPKSKKCCLTLRAISSFFYP